MEKIEILKDFEDLPHPQTKIKDESYRSNRISIHLKILVQYS